MLSHANVITSLEQSRVVNNSLQISRTILTMGPGYSHNGTPNARFPHVHRAMLSPTATGKTPLSESDVASKTVISAAEVDRLFRVS